VNDWLTKKNSETSEEVRGEDGERVRGSGQVKK
jgi:hypothetical protein